MILLLLFLISCSTATIEQDKNTERGRLHDGPAHECKKGKR